MSKQTPFLFAHDRKMCTPRGKFEWVALANLSLIMEKIVYVRAVGGDGTFRRYL